MSVECSRSKIHITCIEDCPKCKEYFLEIFATFIKYFSKDRKNHLIQENYVVLCWSLRNTNASI